MGRAAIHALPARLGLLLHAWPGLALGLLVLHIAEWRAVHDAGGVAVLHMLVGDGLMLLRALPLWCLLGLPLTWLSERPRTLMLGLMGSVLLLMQAVLGQYHALSGVPLGADLLGYTLAEVRTTVMATGFGGLSLWSLSSLVLALCLFWLSLMRSPLSWAPKTPMTAGILGLCVLGSAALPLQWTAPVAGGTQLTPNKLVYFVSDIVSKKLWKADASSAVATHSPYPFAHAETTPDTLGPLLNLDPATKPNVMLIIVEGLGRSFSGPGARLGSFTPFLDELAARSLYWTNFLATQGRTFAVLPSVLGSLPFGVDNAQQPPHDNLLSLLRSEGYSLRYFSGSNLEFDHQGDYLSTNGMQSLWSERDFGQPERRLSEWGYADGDLLQAVGHAAPLRSPSLTLVQTMSMHTPFAVPEQERYRQRVDARLDQLGIAANLREPYHRQRDVFASILYTDEVLRHFFQKMEKTGQWRNTIVVITGDHRLPELPMDTRLERYHVPLIVASPMLRQSRYIRSLSSHFDIAPAVLALLANRYGWQTPASVHWMGTGLDTHIEWRNLHSLPLKQTKADLDDYVSGAYYMGQDKLYALNDGLQPDPVDERLVQERLRREFAHFRADLNTLERSRQLLPVDASRALVGYSASARTLEPQGRAAGMDGVTVSATQGRWLADGSIEVQGVFTQHGERDAPVFVPLLVLSDAQGQQLAETSAKAMKMQAGQSNTVTLHLPLKDVPPGPLYLALIVSHPDTGKSIGKGQYHVALRR